MVGITTRYFDHDSRHYGGNTLFSDIIFDSEDDAISYLKHDADAQRTLNMLHIMDTTTRIELVYVRSRVIQVEVIRHGEVLKTLQIPELISA